MHNNIMAAGSRDRPPMLATGRYAQWRSRFLRYIDTRPNGDALRKCILKGPYTPTIVTTPAVPATEDSPAVPEQTTVETVMNMTPENRAHFESEKEAIHLILTGIGDEIYSTVDACQTAQEMWEAIERLQQGESLNIQDVKTNLFWEFGQFTSHDGETIESYYTRFYKMMNEMIRNNLTVATMQVNVQFLQQLQPEWSRFVIIIQSFLKDVNARTKKPNVVPISTRKPKSQANKSVATPHKKIVASESTITNSKSYYRMLYKKTNKAWKWWIAQQCPSAYTWVPKTKRKWVPKVRNESVTKKIVQLILFIVDSGCTKHMTGNLSLLCNFVEKYLGTVRFGNDQFAPILGHGDLVQGNITIKRVYYVEGLNHNLFSKQPSSTSNLSSWLKHQPTQAWLWHRRLSHLNFDYINLLSKKDVVIGLPKLKYVKDQLCSSCEVSKAKRSSFKSKTVPSSKGRLKLLHMDLCGPMRVASINGKKYILVIVDDYSRYTWTLFLRSKDETPEVLKDFLTMIQRNLQAPVISVRTDRGTEFLNKTLHAFFKEEGIEHQTSTPRTWNRTILEAMADSAWIEAMQEELHQFDRLQVWELVDKPFGKNEECIDFEEPIAPDASLEAVRILSAYPAPQRRFYVAQPDGFHDPDHQTKFYRLQETSLYGLKQAPRAWYDELSKFLISKGFTKGIIDPTLFTIKYGEDILLVQIYVDDIIFGSTNPKFSKRFEKLMHGRFEMSLMGEMKFFLGLQIHQSPRGIFINQAKYTLEILKKHGMEKGQSIGTPMATKPKLDADLSGEPVDQTDYRSKIGSLMYLTSSRPDIVQAVCTIHMGHFIAGNRMGFCIELTADFRCGRSLADALILYSQKHFLEEYKFPKSDKLVIDVQEVRCYCMVIHRGEYMAIICNLCSVKCGYCGHKAFKIMASTTTKIKKNGCE
ncbi:retrovirus-related pol polyprotein from transposon TNT 1-94 [Tanacetum coccineum]